MGLKEETKTYSGLERYSLKWIVGQNLFIMVYFGVGFVGLYSLQIWGYPAVAIAYALFIIIMLAVVLRKHLCTNCYYYGKRCNTGWGLLSSYMFKKHSGNYEFGIKLANIVWGFVAIVPIVGMIISLLFNFSIIELFLLGLFIILTCINLIIHQKACVRCKMKHTCPAYFGDKLSIMKK